MYLITCNFKFSNTIIAKFSGDPWVTGQVFNGSYGSWVSLGDPLSALMTIFVVRLRNCFGSAKVIDPGPRMSCNSCFKPHFPFSPVSCISLFPLSISAFYPTAKRKLANIVRRVTNWSPVSLAVSSFCLLETESEKGGSEEG
jgi:hypothetical protein